MTSTGCRQSCKNTNIVQRRPPTECRKPETRTLGNHSQPLASQIFPNACEMIELQVVISDFVRDVGAQLQVSFVCDLCEEWFLMVH